MVRMVVERIHRDTAMSYTTKYHYLKRVSPCNLAFGLFVDDILGMPCIKGVAVYGVPVSSTLLKGVCGESEAHNVYELNRVWVADDMPKNTESYFIAQTLKHLDREIIISYADSAQGHVGVIYQATNWIYTGMTNPIKDPRVKGLEHQHWQTYAHGMRKAELEEKYGDRLYWEARSKKHRYVFFACGKRRRKQLRKKLKYPTLPYPKGE